LLGCAGPRKIRFLATEAVKEGVLMPRPSRIAIPAMLLLLGAPAVASAQEGQQLSMAEMFLWSDSMLGLFVIWLLIILSVISLGMTFMFALKYRRPTLVPDDTHESLQQMLQGQQFREAIDFASSDNSYLGKLVHAALNEASNGYQAMAKAIEDTGDTETGRIVRPLEFLNVLGQVSPMMGLFGTVYGMIVAFQQLVAAGGNPDPAQLAAGIATALVTTFWGLVVAIPALAAHALIRNRIDALTTEGVELAVELIRPFRPTPRRGGGGGGGSGGSSGGGKGGGSSGPASPKVQQ
jgi:biopolymer transport protein ExbB